MGKVAIQEQLRSFQTAFLPFGTQTHSLMNSFTLTDKFFVDCIAICGGGLNCLGKAFSLLLREAAGLNDSIRNALHYCPGKMQGENPI